VPSVVRGRKNILFSVSADFEFFFCDSGDEERRVPSLLT